MGLLLVFVLGQVSGLGSVRVYQNPLLQWGYDMLDAMECDSIVFLLVHNYCISHPIDYDTNTALYVVAYICNN